MVRVMRAANDDAPPDYAELHCLSDFSFQRGASTANELFARAKEQGYTALAITDECTLAGAVRALMAAEKFELPLIVGSEMRVEDGPRCVLLVESKAGYTALCGLITDARRRAEKGEYRLLASDFDRPLEGLLALWLPGDTPDLEQGRWLRERFPSRCWMAVELHCGPNDSGRLRTLRDAARALGLRCVASGDVHMHVRARRELQDVMTAIRLRTSLKEAGYALFPNGERHLRSRAILSAIYPPDMLDETLAIAARCTFHLKRDLVYEYPRELVPSWHTPATWLRQLVKIGIRRRWKEVPPAEGHRRLTEKLIEKELELIEKLEFEKFFLTVHDVVRFARVNKILCQGRGSAANSAVCYALGITELRPGQSNMLFERFISENRKNEPPDIDVDFEHERREEVLQYVFNYYGRRRAALATVVISYRGRSAVRDVGRALGLPEDQAGELAKTLDRWSNDAPLPGYLRENGFDPDTLLMRKLVELTSELVGMPRHLSQHPGGFLISEHDLSTIVPVENAAMDDRTVVQWDKDDIEYMGMLKVDCLALGMLTCIRKTLDLLRDSGRRDISMAHIARCDHRSDEGAKVFEMIQAADSIGVFQIESRAQMTMAPRLKPSTFYDLVIQIAIVRPGPIQGDMVQPYLRRKKGVEAVTYEKDELRPILERTLGVPLFQEQVMQIAITAAGYSPADADQLRRSMAAWKRSGKMEEHRLKLTEGLLRNGYDEAFAARIFEQIKGFGSYGFPESHAASFALLCWQSAWLKCHEPTAFAAGLLNSQPMGFYSPSQIVQDLRRHGIDVRPVDIRFSDWDCTLEFRGAPDERTQPPALRLGMRLIDGFNEAGGHRVVAARNERAFTDAADLCKRAVLNARERNVLADAGALRGLLGHRHKARWLMAGVESKTPLLDETVTAQEGRVALPLPSVEEEIRTDYATLGLTLGRHPLSLLRGALAKRGLRRSRELKALPNDTKVAFAGIVTLRQRPGTASGVTFLTLEDEDGLTNIVVWKRIADRDRRALLGSRLLLVRGHMEAGDGVQHLIAHRLENLDHLLGALSTSSRDFH
ncbi:error-prone DNA polymerase [Lysobacter sp. TY2-98]|uniref:error-prone DNA polymerase n=1 Tax=Lysobacter sp. TY2-98 TaxID=2290922 RepID=UPI000E20B427|nr:error-prone DNA polymerase [Lysobacter sp. TY2-98]AXK72730.1 error-prone DNA polymerase [Lysobacter sp. TY2-98]